LDLSFQVDVNTVENDGEICTWLYPTRHVAHLWGLEIYTKLELGHLKGNDVMRHVDVLGRSENLWDRGCEIMNSTELP
jgi:hypothetical protein